MKKELPHFHIGNEYGGSQNWLTDLFMKIGGCATVTACDMAIYLKMYKGKDKLYLNDIENISRRDYNEFSKYMKTFLRPRISGIDKLEMYIEGMEAFFKDVGESGVSLSTLYGNESAFIAKKVLKKQIDKGIPVPTLTLRHNQREFIEYVWHWYILNAYEEVTVGSETFLMVKAVTNGYYRWVDLYRLWNTGFSKKGGFIIFDV